MARIIQFPLHKAVRGEVFCREANVVFPRVHRVTVTTTLDHLRAIGLDAGQAAKLGMPWVPSTTRFYTLDPAGRSVTCQVGDVTSEPVTTMEASADATSILINHHPTKEEAIAFLDGRVTQRWYATGFGRNGDDAQDQEPEWAEVGGEYFTLTPLRSIFGQTRPRLVYQCTYSVPDSPYPAPDGVDEVWIRAADDDGRLVCLWGKE